jgi:hypothetical protein
VIIRKRLVSLCGSLAALILGGLFFFDVIGVFGLGLAITGVVIFVLSSVAVFRFTTLEGMSP